jgi:hypothetical protein
LGHVACVFSGCGTWCLTAPPAVREFVNTRAAASTGVTDEVAVLGGAMGLADQIIVGRYVQTAGSTMEFF